MADQYTDVHGFKVKYDDSSETLEKAIKYLAEELDKSEAEVFFDAARRDRVQHTSHIEVSSKRSGKDLNLTLVYRPGGYYRLRKRSTGSGFFR